jgi:hypothetical protein
MMDSHLCTPPDGRAAGDLWRCTCGAVWPDLMEDRERLETIVRALAVFDPGVEIPTSSTRNETATLCITCDTVLAGDAWDEDQGTFVAGPRPHTPDCAWALARQWVEANPAQLRPGHTADVDAHR